jgi:hypothetical protein
VYCPELSTVPPPDSWTDQVTAVDWPVLVPVTEALNEVEAPARTLALFGATETATPAPPSVGGGTTEFPASPTLPLHPWARTAVRMATGRLIRRRIPRLDALLLPRKASALAAWCGATMRFGKLR